MDKLLIIVMSFALLGCREDAPAPKAAFLAAVEKKQGAELQSGALPEPVPVKTEEPVAQPEEKVEEPPETPSSPPPLPEPVNVLQFLEVWQNVQSHYPVLRKRYAQIREMLAKKSQAGAGFLPSLNVGLGWNRTNDPTGVFMSKLKQKSFSNNDFVVDRLNHPESRSNYQGMARLEWPIFDAFQSIAAFRTSKYFLQSSEAEAKYAKMEASLLALETYLRCLLAGNMSRLAEETLARSEADLEEALKLKEQGLVLGADFFMAKVVSGQIRQVRNQTRAQEHAVCAALNILQGRDSQTPFELPGRIPSPSENETSLAQWTSDALLYRSDLTALYSAVNARESELGRAKARWLPYVSAFGEVERNTHDFDGSGSNYTVGVQASFDLFDPAYMPRIREQRAKLEQFQQDLAGLKDRISQSIAEAFARYHAVLDDVNVSRLAAEDALEAERLTETLYEEGRKSIADLQEVRQMRLMAQNNYEENLLQAELICARLFFLSGQLNEERVMAFARRLNP